VLRGSSDFDERLSWVYGAALRAADGDEAAEDATRSAFEWAAADEPLTLVMARAVRVALDRSPAHPLSLLPFPEREAIGLARIVGLSVREVSSLVGCDAAEVKRRMRRGMQRLANGVSVPVAS
jgi:DNA-directed RNA polymerase specialized sigma24 family protein